MLPLAMLAPVAGQVLGNAAGAGTSLLIKGASNMFSPAARAQRQAALKAAGALRRNNFGYSDPQRVALLRGGQRQANALQEQAQGNIALQQGAMGGPVQGGYAAAQGQVARAAQDATAQQRAQVNAASDQMAVQQRADALRLVKEQAARGRANTAEVAAVVGPAAQDAVQQGRDYKAGTGAFDDDEDLTDTNAWVDGTKRSAPFTKTVALAGGS